MIKSGVSKLDVSVIEKIHTGQIVFNIAAACKELIENSLDAGATSIDIRVVDYGVTLLEISDNGKGIPESDFDGLAQAHWTSKLLKYDDLGSLKTYGFRGEALNALATISKLTVVTRHSSVEAGTKLEFDSSGILKGKSPCARTVGTTVIVERFLEPLAVRRKEFERNAKNEYQKLLHVVQAFCLILRNVRIELSHRLDNCKKTILSSYANQTLKENVCNIYGAKQLETLIDFIQVSPLKEQLTENNFREDAPLNDFTIEGLVSTIEKGAGRSASDRQFVFVNQRPCDFTKVLKCVSEVYRQYNRQQCPVVILNIQVAKGRVDFNVTPDKRQVMIADEDLLLFIIKTSLGTLYEKLLGVCKLGEASSASSVLNASSTLASSAATIKEKSATLSLTVDRFKRQFQPGEPGTSSDVMVDGSSAPKQSKIATSVNGAGMESSLNEGERRTIIERSGVGISALPLVTGRARLSEEFDGRSEKSRNSSTLDRQRRSSASSSINNDMDFVISRPRSDYFKAASSTGSASERSTTPGPSFVTAASLVKRTCQNENRTLDSWIDRRQRRVSETSNISGNSSLDFHLPQHRLTLKDLDTPRRPSSRDSGSEDDVNEIRQFRPPSRARSDGERKDGERRKSGPKVEEKSLPVENPWRGYRKSAEVPFSFDLLRQLLDEKQQDDDLLEEDTDENDQEFHAKITPSDSTQAELELKRCLKKVDFATMRVVGQFNHGFIIAQLHDDLFIVDQHASDEKYNFEYLQKTASFQSQKLYIALPLELSVSQEQIIISRGEIFRKNGFEFVADSTKPPGKRFAMAAMPSCSSCTFDKSDVDEIIAILDDDPNVKMYRPLKLRRIFASKACRKSVMIGKPLSVPEMEKILRHLAEIEQPWNCPHGRPTVRHLFNIRQIPPTSGE